MSASKQRHNADGDHSEQNELQKQSEQILQHRENSAVQFPAIPLTDINILTISWKLSVGKKIPLFPQIAVYIHQLF